MANEETVSTPADLDAPILPDEPSNAGSSTDDETWLDDAEADKSEAAEDNTEDTSEDETKEPESDDKDSEDAEPTEAEDSETKPEETADEKEQARQRYLERQSRRNQPDPYVDAIKKEADQRLAAIEDDTQRQLAELQVKDQLREIQDARTGLITDNEFAQRDFEVFNPKSDSFNETAYDHFLKEYETAYVVKDPQSGEVLGTKGPTLYQYLSDKAELIANLKQAGARESQTSKAKMKSATTTPSVAAPKAEKRDAFGEAFDKEF